MYELNPDNFKKWMKNNSSDQENCSTIEGCEVQAKFSAKKTIKNMCIEEGKPGKVIREFMEDGGIVESVSGNEYLVTVNSGKFLINKKFLVT